MRAREISDKCHNMQLRQACLVVPKSLGDLEEWDAGDMHFLSPVLVSFLGAPTDLHHATHPRRIADTPVIPASQGQVIATEERA